MILETTWILKYVGTIYFNNKSDMLFVIVKLTVIVAKTYNEIQYSVSTANY